MSIKKDIVWRVGLIYLGVLVFALVIASKVIFLQFISGEKWQQMAENSRIRNRRVKAHRGDILSADGKLLASSIPYYQVHMDFTVASDKLFNENVDSLADCLRDLFRNKTKEAWLTELKNARKHKEQYYPIKYKVNYLELKALKTFPIMNEGRYKGGIIYTAQTKRIRPHNGLARRTIGFQTQDTLDRDVGLEGAFNDYLQGKDGFRKEQKISGGKWMPVRSEGEVDSEDGASIVTTINVELQDVAHRALLKQLQLHDAQYGSVVLMDVKTGDVKAIVNLSKVGEVYFEDYNYAVGASTEPGSTFKLPALMTALEDGYIDIHDTIDTGNGRFKPWENDDFEIKDDKDGYGVLSVQQIFEKSSNVGMAKIIHESYIKKPHLFIDRLYKMSLNESLELKIPGEGKPQIKYPGGPLWSGVSLAQMAYGYEVRLTPLQILTFYNAVANDGKMVKPRFVKEVRNNGKIVKTYPPHVINQSICSKSTIKKVNTILEGVVENGTAQNLKASHFKIAGKTGTTQIYNKVGGYKGKRSYQASFAGYFPASGPQYSCIVVISAPSRNVYHGNKVAGPVFLEIANKVYATSISLQKPLNNLANEQVQIPFSKNGYSKQTQLALKKLGIPTSVSENAGDWIITQKKENHVLLGNKRTIENLMPNLMTMGLKDALFMLENMGLEVDVIGRGSIKKQSIPPGTRVYSGQRVTLEMSFVEG